MAITKFARAVILLVFVFSFAVWSWGQGAQGRLVGTVTDSTGAVVPNTTVTVVNMATNVAVRTTTTNAGDFSVPFLTPGMYSVIVEAKGFEKGAVRAIAVEVGQTVRADVVLKPGAASETVEVTSGVTTALDTDSEAVGQVISEQQVSDLPMENRGFANLLLLAPGAITPIQDRGADNIITSGVGNDYVDISGARADANGYTIDGMTNNTPYWNNTMINLSLDAIQEFKEVSSTYSAAYGTYASQIIVSTKSGTNNLHGTLFEFARNNDFDAVSDFSAAAPLHQNDYGYSLGGPVYIPKLYTGRNRTFFFANFERIKSASSSTIYSIAPTSDELAGYMSSTVPIINPATGYPFAQTTSPSGVPDDYYIPPSDWARLATVANAAPTGTVFTVAGQLVNGTNNTTTVTNPNFNNQQTYRIDQAIGSKDKLTARVTLTNAFVGGAVANTYGADNSGTSVQAWSVIETHAFRSNLVNNARVGLIDYNNVTTGPAAPTAEINALGLQNVYALAYTTRIFPEIQWSNGLFSLAGGALGPPNELVNRVLNYEDSVEWVHGRHDLSMGFLAYTGNDLSNQQDLLGIDEFSGFYTTPAGDTPTAGNTWADYLLGDLAGGQAVVPTAYGDANPMPLPWLMSGYRLQPYVEDDWKVNGRLALNLGLRYDFSSIPSVNTPIWGSLIVPGGVVCMGQNSVDRKYIASGDGGTLFQLCNRGASPKKPFAPRVGFEFRPFSKSDTVIRGGYGVFFVPVQLHEFDSRGDFPFSETANPTGLNFNNLYPATLLIANSTDIAGFYQAEPAGPVINPYLQQWSFGVEQQLHQNVKLNVAYVASMGTHLETRLAANQPYGYSATDTPEEREMRYPYYNFGTYGLDGTPFAPGYLDQGNFTAASNYNSLQTSLNYRAKDVALLASFTWASSMDDASASEGTALDNAGWQGPMDAHDIHLDYSKSSFDVNKRFVLSAVYQLPIGRGKRFGSGMNRAADTVAGGWQVNGIYTAQGGIPFDVAAADIGGVLLADAQRANKTGSPYPSGFKKSANEWFDIGNYVQPPEGVFGSEPRDDIRAPGVNNLDFSIFKNFSIWEEKGMKFQLRGEAFNAANHVQLGAPSNTVGVSDNGVINSVEIPGRIIQVAGKVIF